MTVFGCAAALIFGFLATVAIKGLADVGSCLLDGRPVARRGFMTVRQA